MYNIIVVFLLIFVINRVVSYDTPKCKNCRWFIENKRQIEYLGLCGMFGNKIKKDNKNFYFYEYAIHCRNNESFCGTKGALFDNINGDTKYIEYMSESKKSSIESPNEYLMNNDNYMNDLIDKEKKYMNYYINNIAKKYNIKKYYMN